MKKLLIFALILFLTNPAFSAEEPAWHATFPSLFFRSVAGVVIPIMPQDGYRLPVDAVLATGTSSLGTVRPPVLLAPTRGTLAALGGASFTVPADGYHVALSVQTFGAQGWYIVGTSTIAVGGTGAHPLTFWSDFDVPPSAPVAVISSTAASITYQIDRR